MKIKLILGLFLALCLNVTAERPAVPKKFTFQDLYGNDATLSAAESNPACVLFFFSNTCPVARRYVPRINQLASAYRARDVQFVAVNVSPGDTLAEVARFAWDYEITFPVVKDPRFVAVKALGISRTPEVTVLDRNFAAVYRGRIDDQYRLGGVRPEATRHDLVDALDALLEGRELPASHVPAEGCVVTVLEDNSPPGELVSAPDATVYNVEWVGVDTGKDSVAGIRTWTLSPAVASTAWIKGLRVEGAFESAKLYYVEAGKDARHYFAGALRPGHPVRWNEDEALRLPAGAVPVLETKGEVHSVPIIRLAITDATPEWELICSEAPFSRGVDDHNLLEPPRADSQPRYIAFDTRDQRTALKIEWVVEGGTSLPVLSLPLLDPGVPGPHVLPESTSIPAGKGHLRATLERPGYLMWPTAVPTVPEFPATLYTYWASKL